MPRPAVPSTLVRRPGAAPRRPPLVRIAVALLAVVATTVLTTACSGDDDSQPPTTTQPATTTTTTGSAATTTTTTQPTTTTEPTTTTAVPTPEEEVKTAYLEASQVLDEAFETSNPDAPGLVETRVDPNLSDVRATLSSRRDKGQVLRYPTGRPPIQDVRSVKMLSADRSLVVVCVIDNAVLTDAATGKPLDDSVVSRTNRVTLTRTSGRWLVSEVSEPSAVPNGNGCAKP